MPVRNSLVGLSASDLTEIRDAAKACIVAQTVRGYSYTIAGRSFSFPSLDSAQELLFEANHALGLLDGTRSMTLRANFNNSFNRA